MTKKTYNASNFGIHKLMVSDDALFIIEKLQNAGYDGLIVGGGIRDLLLGVEPKDFDIATNASPEDVKKVFKSNSIIIGRRFKIVHVFFENINPNKMVNFRPVTERNIIEVSTYRSSHIPKHAIDEFGKITNDNNYGTQKEDAFRRDFTINAMFYDPIKGIIIDYANGMDDIKNKLIRIIGEPEKRYTEDPVRFLRAIRLSEKLQLNIEEKTFEPFHNMKYLLCNESKGRMYEETLKVLLSGHSLQCILRLKELQLPKGVFTLFDKLFFKKNMNQFALRILEKTDTRLKETDDISTIFILAGLLWSLVNEEWDIRLDKTSNPKQSLTDSINLIREYAFYLGITKYSFSSMREIWNMQIEFEAPNIKRINEFIKSPRFRQAFHLLGVRAELNQINPEIFDCWNSIITATTEEEKQKLYNQLDDIPKRFTLSKPGKKKRRRKKGKNHEFI